MRPTTTGVGLALGQACVATVRADCARMAPVEQHLMADRSAALALAPDSVSRDAEVVVLTSCGYEIVAKGGRGCRPSWGSGAW